MPKHYLLVVLKGSGDTVEREYVELLSPDEPEKSARERWARAHPDMNPDGKPRQRYVETTLARLMAEPLYTQICHPSSWWREQQEAPGYVPPGRKRSRRRGA
jgi:hypothetical protein